MIRIESARSAMARSSERLTILLTFMPAAGSYSYIVMTGPGCTRTTFPRTPKSESFFSRILEFISRLSRSKRMALSGGSWKRSTSGNVKGPEGPDSSKRKVSCEGEDWFSRSASWSTIAGPSPAARAATFGAGAATTAGRGASGGSSGCALWAAATGSGSRT